MLTLKDNGADKVVLLDSNGADTGAISLSDFRENGVEYLEVLFPKANIDIDGKIKYKGY